MYADSFKTHMVLQGLPWEKNDQKKNIHFMIMSVNTDKASYKIQHSFLI